jgi:hypothetical protein
MESLQMESPQMESLQMESPCQRQEQIKHASHSMQTRSQTKTKWSTVHKPQTTNHSTIIF